MYMAGIWELYVYGRYMGAIWLQRSILTTHVYGTYEGHILWDLQWTNISKSISNVTLVKVSDEVQHVKKKLKI